MGARPIPERVLLQAVRLVESKLREGFPAKGARGTRIPTAIVAAGDALEAAGKCKGGTGYQYVYNHVRRAERQGIGPDWAIKPKPRKARKSRRASVAAQIVARGPNWLGMDRGKLIRVGVIPGAHVAPGESPKRLEWIGRHFASEGVEEIVCLGDFGTFDSVSGHAPPGTLSFEKLPRVNADFEAVEAGFAILDKGLGRWRGRKHFTKGNHEFRLDRFEDRNPQVQGLLVERFDDLAERFGWRVYPYREYCMIGGVGFIHIPINAGGKPYGGKMSAHAIARDALFSIVHGHTHVRQSAHVAKLGQSKLVSVISPGCALPAGHVEDYAQHNATGWWWGVSCLTLRDGVILDEAHISMETLERRYRERRKVEGVSRA